MSRCWHTRRERHWQPHQLQICHLPPTTCHSIHGSAGKAFCGRSPAACSMVARPTISALVVQQAASAEALYARVRTSAQPISDSQRRCLRARRAKRSSAAPGVETMTPAAAAPSRAIWPPEDLPCQPGAKSGQREQRISALVGRCARGGVKLGDWNSKPPPRRFPLGGKAPRLIIANRAVCVDAHSHVHALKFSAEGRDPGHDSAERIPRSLNCSERFR